MFNKKINLYTLSQPVSWNKITDTGILQIKHEYDIMVDKYITTRQDLLKLNEKYLTLENKYQQLQQQTDLKQVIFKKNNQPHHHLEYLLPFL
jgi:hypothetical protein